MEVTHASQTPEKGSFHSRDYTFIEKIGEGGFSQVYKAIQHNTQKYVAIKFLILCGDANQDKIAAISPMCMVKRGSENRVWYLSSSKDCPPADTAWLNVCQNIKIIPCIPFSIYSNTNTPSWDCQKYSASAKPR
ncbi:hypothetical protein FS373_14505 [Shewanella sp. YLB-07]|nr:hypothetical protein [Shewanella sp. YLB-07]